MSGNPVADEAIEDVRRRLVRLAVKLVWHREDAEDLAQEAFRIAAGSGVLPSEERFAPWLLRTVANLCLNQRRKKRPESLDAHLDQAIGQAGEDRIENAERLDRVLGAIAKLPDQQRLALVMRTMEQMSYEEIAGVMELSVAAVRTHVHLARVRLIELVGEDK